MALILNGTDGLSDVDGTAATPAIRGTDTNTGIFFPAADTIAFAEGGVESARFDANGNLGIGTTTPTKQISLGSTGTATLGFTWNGDGLTKAGIETNHTTGEVRYGAFTNYFPTFYSNNTERMRITSGGELLVGQTTSSGAGTKQEISFAPSSQVGFRFNMTDTTYNNAVMEFRTNGPTRVGFIFANGSSTTYSTSSDYRLKENIEPMTGALGVVQQLKPVTYNWKVDGSSGQGFIAHELQAIVPDCVTGEKDAVDAEGSPVYQGIDTSFLVATLTCAIQELKAELDSVKAELATLKGAA